NSTPKANRALLIAVTDFHHRSGLSARKGARKDIDRLFKILSKLNYKVTLLYDPTAKEILDAYREVCRKQHGEYFFSVISSHGEEGLIFGQDGNPVKTADIFSMFTPRSCPMLSGKSKMFFIQACRGNALDDGVQLETDSILQQDNDFSQYFSIPEDTIVMYATSPGYAAFLHPLGSVFLQTLCNLLEGEERHLELTRFLTRINYHVAFDFEAKGKNYKGKKEMPCIVSRMVQDAYPFLKGGRADQTPKKPSTK
uniref:Caspase 3 n=2 Tax=Latimeria chalumnae TaxID=7897 RepID=H3AXG0_LATCH